MGRVYATEEESGTRILVRIECDAPMCGAKILPNPAIAESGWTKRGSIVDGFKFEYAYCPDHANMAMERRP